MLEHNSDSRGTMKTVCPYCTSRDGEVENHINNFSNHRCSESLIKWEFNFTPKLRQQ